MTISGLSFEEIIMSLDQNHNVPMDIIRYILSEWVSYPAIENNEQFRKNIDLWFDDKNIKKQAERQAMLKKYGHISDWKTTKITDMSRAFYQRAEFNEEIGRWDVSHVTDMSYMLLSCYSFTSDLSHWDVSQVISMKSMFLGCIRFSSDVSQWDVSRVEDMSYMFYNCYQFNSNIQDWDVSQVKYMPQMFILLSIQL